MVAPQAATVSVYDHGLLYGDGVFEGIRFYHGRAFCLNEHLQRLFDSAHVCALSIPYSAGELHDAVLQTIAASQLNDGYVRLVVTRGVGGLGIDPRRCKSATVFIIADNIQIQANDALEKGIRVIIAHTRRLPLDGLDPRVKSLNYLNHIMAKMEANQAGAAEAIMLNQLGHVSEGSSDNVFIVKNQVLITPPVSDGALDGITRATIMELARELKIETKLCSIAPYDLYVADECFISGTAVELVPVKEIDGRQLAHCPGPVFTRLQQAFMQRVSEVKQLDASQHRFAQ